MVYEEVEAAVGLQAVTRWIEVVVVDPKGGSGAAADSSAGLHTTTATTPLALLRAATDLMRRRAARLRGHTRLHAPTFDEPLMVVIIDEIAALTAYIGDRKAARWGVPPWCSEQQPEAPARSATVSRPALLEPERPYRTRVLILIQDQHIIVINAATGEVLRVFTLDPTRDNQPRGVKCGNSPENRLQM